MEDLLEQINQQIKDQRTKEIVSAIDNLDIDPTEMESRLISQGLFEVIEKNDN